jgi:hypothetical protein
MGETNLYIFVDESGNHSQGSDYTLAGTWCFSKQNHSEKVFNRTKDRLLQSIDEAEASELKGANLTTSQLNKIISIAGKFAYDDETVDHKEQWIGGTPIGTTVHTVDPSAAQTVIKNTTGEELNAPELIQSMSLLRVLDPVFSLRHRKRGDLGKVEVTLDSGTWQGPVSRVSPQFESVSGTSQGICFDTADSQTVPGIQLSDLVAYSWRRKQIQDECTHAVSTIDNWRLPW